jgi:ribosome-binding protein aMBF1 (putative translation factor)
METVEKNGKVFVLVPRKAWQKIAAGELAMPKMPPADEHGNRPALEAVRALIARGIIRDRAARGLSQAELAGQSGVGVETLNRIERPKATPDEATLNRIDRAFRKTTSKIRPMTVSSKTAKRKVSPARAPRSRRDTRKVVQ